MTKSKETIKEVIEPIVEVAEPIKELTSNEFNDLVFSKIQSLEDEILELKDTLKPIEAIKNASLAECNKLAKKNANAIREMRRFK